ncbi:AraC family transcriptional regulator [Castellaniella sp. WN]
MSPSKTGRSSPPAIARDEPHESFWRDPALSFVESRRACRSRACYVPHRHPTFSIGAVDEGRSLFTGAADGPIALRPGTLVFVPAERVHACNPVPDTAWSYQMLHLDAAWLLAVRKEYARAGSHEAEPVRIATSPAIYGHFRRLNALLFSDADPRDKEAALIEFMGDADAEAGLRIEAPIVPSRQAERIRPALDHLRAAPDSDTPLDELARLASMSRYQLIRAFRAATGMTPHAWQLNQRVNLARERIRRGASISEVALLLGFADQAHFQRVFKAYTGVTPGRFRA